MNKAFDNNIIRKALIRVWEKYKGKFYCGIPMWMSTHEALSKEIDIKNDKWLTYKDLLIEEDEGQLRLRTRQEMNQVGIICQWFPHKLSERMKMDNKLRIG